MIGRPRTWQGYKNSKYGERHTFYCKICGKSIEKLISQCRLHLPKYCSKECYHKSLRNHGKWLYKNYGRKALVHLENLRVEAWNLGVRVRYWWRTTKKELLEHINKIKQDIKKKITIIVDDYYGPQPAFIELDKNKSPPNNKILTRKICQCGMDMTFYQSSWWCECGASGPP